MEESSGRLPTINMITFIISLHLRFKIFPTKCFFLSKSQYHNIPGRFEKQAEIQTYYKLTTIETVTVGVTELYTLNHSYR